jgi:NADPH2:quinone reductase
LIRKTKKNEAKLMDSGKSSEFLENIEHSGKIPENMTAIHIREPGGPDVLEPTKIPTPIPGAGEVLVKVAAAGINRPDVIQRLGLYPPPPGAPDTPGLEVSGTVVALGPDVGALKLGDQICALVPGGGYAQYCIVQAPLALPIPGGLSLTEAAALPETFFTVWTNVFDRGRLRAGETLLIHGGSSGIGTTAIQIASQLGARVFATAGSAEKCAKCEELGAERAINYREENYAEIVKDLTGGKGVNVILDMVGGDYIEHNIAALAVDGRLVNIAYLNGPVAEINFMPIMLKRLTLTGSTLRPQALDKKAAIAESLKKTVWPLLDAGKIAPVIDSTYPLEDAKSAHARMDSGAHIGKIVLEVEI